MKPLNVLSVDWDYLVGANAHERYVMFPDGGNENIGKQMSDIIWATRYACYPEIEEIGVYEEGLKKLKQFISKWVRLKTQVVIVESHANAYQAVKLFKKDNQPVNIINVDFHHDCYDFGKNVILPDGNNLDCGNWVTQLFVDSNNKIDSSDDSYYTWVKRDDSDMLEDGFGWMNVVDIDKLEDANGFGIDVLFICKSGVWSPPHLDDQFAKFCNWCADGINNGDPILEPGIIDSRYTDEFQDFVLREREVNQQMIDLMSKNNG